MILEKNFQGVFCDIDKHFWLNELTIPEIGSWEKPFDLLFWLFIVIMETKPYLILDVSICIWPYPECKTCFLQGFNAWLMDICLPVLWMNLLTSSGNQTTFSLFILFYHCCGNKIFIDVSFTICIWSWSPTMRSIINEWTSFLMFMQTYFIALGECVICTLENLNFMLSNGLFSFIH